MIRVLLDTNVVLDVLLGREPWRVEAEAIWKAHHDGRIAAYVTASSVTDVFYVARRLAGRDRAWDAVRTLVDQLNVISVGAAELIAAAGATGDFEDRLQSVCAAAVGLDFIVTRDPAGFVHGSVTAIDPADFLARVPPAS